MALKALLAILLALPVFAQEQGAFNSACFLGLLDSDSPATLNSCKSPDLLNTESNLQGTAAVKRKGFAKTADLTYSTAPVTGSHSFIDSSGNRKDIVCQDRVCLQSTNGNAFALFYTTGAAGITRWSWVDVGGIAYGGNNRYDKIIKYDGSSTSNPVGMPQGSILELAQDRLVIGDISGSPNRVHYSSAGAYEQFTTGLNPEDSFFDEIGAPGDKIRGLKCIGGFCNIFKTSSITGCEVDNQYNTKCAVRSPTIGTTDPGSIASAGSCLYFRAQDKNYWELCDSFRPLSQGIPNFVRSQGGGLSGGEITNTQTTQTDWNNGSQSPASSWNTSAIPGSIFPSSITLVDTSSGDFVAGTLPASLTTSAVVGSIQLSSSSFIVYNGDFETGTEIYWTFTTGGGARAAVDTAYAITGTYGAVVAVNSASGNINAFVRILAENDAVLYSIAYSDVPSILNGYTIDLYALGLSTRSLKIQFNAINNTTGGEAIATSSTFTAISSITWQGVSDSIFGWGKLDNIKVNRYFSLYQSSATPVTFFSQQFNTGFSTPTGGPFSVSSATPAGTGLTYQMRSSANGSSGFTAWSTIVNGNRDVQTLQYHQYLSTFTTSVGTSTPRVDDVTIQAVTTGTFRTQCIQPGASITSWGILSCAQSLGGNGSEVFYATSAATCAALPTSAPTSWQNQTSNNSTLATSTNTALYVGWRSLLGSTTDQAQIDACVLNWTEGTPVQPVWSVYDSIKNAVYWTATINNAPSTNRLLKYDRNLNEWYPMDIPAQAPRMINNSLYFGGASSGTWNQYGLVDADLGQAINAYWTSKDIGSDKPFQEKDFQTLSLLSRNNGTGNMTATWTFSNAETGSAEVSLSTGTGISYARSNYNLPKTSPQNFVKIRIGNNSTTPFEVLGLGVTWGVLDWNVNGP